MALDGDEVDDDDDLHSADPLGQWRLDPTEGCGRCLLSIFRMSLLLTGRESAFYLCFEWFLYIFRIVFVYFPDLTPA